MARGARNMDGARGLRWRGTEEDGPLARPERPSRCTLPITALRVMPPSSPAIWLAERPSDHSFLSSSTRSSVQLIPILPLSISGPAAVRRIPSLRPEAQKGRRGARMHYEWDSGDSPPHEMSYLTVTKLQYAVTPAQESPKH